MLESLGNLGDFIGGIAVVATLIYLAVQVRQNTKQIAQSSDRIHAQTYRDDQSAHSSTAALVVQDPELAEIFRRGNVDPESLSEVEWIRFTFFYGTMLSNYQSTLYQLQQELLEPDLWENQMSNIKFLLRTPGGKKYWETMGFMHTRALRSFVDREVFAVSEPDIIPPKPTPGESAAQQGVAADVLTPSCSRAW